MHLPSTQAPCVHPNPDPQRIVSNEYACLAFDAMGCRFELLIDASGTALSGFDAQAIAEEMRELVLDWHQCLSIFETTSIAFQINRTPADNEILLDDDMFSLCTLCDRLRVRTKGAFNIAAGTLMHSHGFRDSHAVDNTALADLDLERAFVLDTEKRSITKSDDRVSLDFGAIAKGYVLDLIRTELEEYGINNAFIHGGTSSILAIGEDHKANPWTTNICGGSRIHLPGLAAGISENHSQTRSQGDGLIGHVMDPSTNNPANNTITQIACIHTSAAVADAYSTACCVNPSLADDLCTDPCTIIKLDSSSTPIIYDPLGVVQVQRTHHDRT